MAATPTSGAGSSEARVLVDPGRLARLRIGKQIDLTDARGKKRRLLVVETDADGFVAECMETYCLTPDTALTYKGNHGHKLFTTYPSGIAALHGSVRLHRGDRLQRCSEGQGHGATADSDAAHAAIPRISCTRPQVFERVRAGERI